MRGKGKVVLAAVVGVLAVLVAVGTLTNGDGPGDEPVLLTDEAAAAGCLPLQRRPPLASTPLHRTGPIAYPEAPPDSGDHAPNTLRNAKRFYSRDDNPPPEPAVHNLEHGLVVAWYDDELPADQVAALEELSQGMGPRFVAVPWRRSVFPDGRHIVLTAWRRTQRCQRVSAAMIEQFVEDNADSEDAPEKGYSV